MTNAEEFDRNEQGHGISLARRMFKPVGAILVVSALAISLWWSPWKSDDSPGRRFASVPEHLCGGLLTAGDVEPLDSLRTGDELTSSILMQLPGIFSCRVGDESERRPNLFVDISAMKSARLDWTVDDFEWRAHLGPGLVGMMQENSAWLYVPCPGGSEGDLLARVAIRMGKYEFDRPFDPGFWDEERVNFARLLIHAANAAAERAHCQAAPLSDAIPPITPQFSGIRSCDNPPEPPGPPPPLDTCSRGIDSVTYRGPLTALAPKPGTIWNNRVLVTKTSGMCGSEAVVWAGWADSLDAESSADVLAHKHRVDEEVRRNGCVVNEQEDVMLPAASG